MFSKTSLSQCTILLHLVLISSNEIFGYVVVLFDRIVGRSVSIPSCDVLDFIAFNNMTHNAINSVFFRQVSELVCHSLYFPRVDFVVSFVDGLVRRVVVLSFCDFRLWCQYSSVK